MIKKLFKEKTSHLPTQLFRYSLSGIVAFGGDFFSLALLTDIFHIHYLISAGIAFLVGTFLSYNLNAHWVFDQRKYDHNKKFEFFIFILLNLIALLLNELLMYFFTDIVSLHYLASKTLSAIILVPPNFYIRKWTLFQKQK